MPKCGHKDTNHPPNEYQEIIPGADCGGEHPAYSKENVENGEN